MSSIGEIHDTSSFSIVVSNNNLAITNHDFTHHAFYCSDMMGKLLFRFEMQNHKLIDISNLSEGIYMISNGITGLKFMKR